MKKILACIAFALLFVCGEFRAEDSTPLDELIAKAAKGDAKAQHALALRYRDGKGVDKDLAQAMHWAHLAADQGDAPAMDLIGHAYLTGRGVKRNPAVAFGYFNAAAKKSAQAGFNLGQCYFGAQGVDLDIPKALEAWKKASEMGSGRAAANAAMVYLSGEGVPADPKEARRLATRSAELNDVSGLVVLGEIQFQAGEIDEARANWTKASKVKPVGATGQPVQPSENMAAQEGADLLKLIDYRKKKSEPGVFAFVDAPHVHQGYNNQLRRDIRDDARTFPRQIDRRVGVQAALPQPGWHRHRLGRSAESLRENWTALEAGDIHPGRRRFQRGH